jgi:hypothetical protein
MSRFAKLQLVGPAAVLAVVLVAEGAALALAQAPGSAVLWYVNLRLFRPLHQVHDLLSASIRIEALQFWLIGLPLFALACYGLARRRSLPLAFATNLSLLYAFVLLCAWYLCRLPAEPLDAPVPALVPAVADADFCLCFVLLLASSFSCVISHASYLRAIRDEAYAV